MIQKEKDLLLKYISMALPYGIKVKTPYNDAILVGTTIRRGYKKDECYVDVITDKQTYPLRYIKPYLRSMLNMTKEELREYNELYAERENNNEYDDIKQYSDLICWLIKNHFDFMDLIPKSLAIEVNESNNPYKE